MIDYDKLEKSLKQLELQFQNYQNSGERDELSVLDREGLAKSVILRFKRCIDMLQNNLFRHVIEELGLPETSNSKKPLFRLADQNQLLPVPVDRWLRYSDARIEMALGYSGEKAAECLEVIEDFIVDAIMLYERLGGKQWR